MLEPATSSTSATTPCWVRTDRQPASLRAEHGDDIADLVASACVRLADRRVVEVDAQGTMARAYEPFHLRRELRQMRVSTSAAGRRGTAIYAGHCGARHLHFFPSSVVEGTLPTP